MLMRMLERRLRTYGAIGCVRGGASPGLQEAQDGRALRHDGDALRHFAVKHWWRRRESNPMAAGFLTW